jgi:hypothetical protein
VLFTDPPSLLPGELYEEAARAYASLVRRRAQAVYQVGRFEQPGLSDLDLLVVPSRPRWDNHWFFSAHARLPRDLRQVFRHDPRLLPPTALDAIRYTTHGSRQLLTGSDVVAGRSCLETPEQKWSILLEGYLSFHRYYWGARAQASARIGPLIARLTSVAHSFRILDSLAETKLAPDLDRDVKALRAGFFASPEPVWVRGLRAWERYCQAFDALERDLGRLLPLRAGEEPHHFARDFLRGRRTLPGLDEEALSERREAVRRYHAEVGRYRFFRGSLFFSAAYERQREKVERRNRVSGLWYRIAERRYRRG